MLEFTQLINVKSLMRQIPPKETAGLTLSRVRQYWASIFPLAKSMGKDVPRHQSQF
jgi:hypothetical protein